MAPDPRPPGPGAAPPRPRLSRRPRVLVTRRLPPPVEARMAELFEVTLNLDDQPLTPDELADRATKAEVLVPTVTDRVDAALLDRLPRLGLLASFGAGVDHIDVAAARQRGIPVSNTPGVLADDTADMALALLLAVGRRLVEGDRLIRRGEWPGWAPTFMLGSALAGKRLGIVGMGRIGQAIARRARAFGLTIHYHNRRRLPEAAEGPLEATWWPSLDAMLGRVDIVSLNCPETPETRHLVDARRLALMPPHAVLVNVARGSLVDEAALVDSLVAGRLAGAGLDVYAHEPRVPPALLALEQVVLLPHLGSATHEARSAMGMRVITNIRAAVDGHRPPDEVLPPA